MKEIKMIIFLLVIFTICSSLLAFGRFAYVKASVIFNRRLYAEIMDLYEIPYSDDAIDESFNGEFKTVESGNQNYYISRTNSPQTVGFTVEGPGLWSILEIFISVKIDEDRMYGLKVLSQGETPGLGARITEPEFLSRFSDLDINPQVQIVKFALTSNQVDAISGATKTSIALQKIINSGISGLQQNMDYIRSAIEE